MEFNSRKISFAAIIATLFWLVVWSANTQAQSASRDANSNAVAAHQVEEKLNRLILKFKDTAQTDKAKSHHFEADGKSDVQAVVASTPLHTKDGRGITLNYLKTIHPNVHVALTNESLSRAELTALTQELAKSPSIDFVEIDEKAYPQMTPNDSNFAADMWNMKPPAVAVGGANFAYAWDRTTTGGVPVKGTGVVIAILDTGYRPHFDLAGNVLTGYDFIAADPDTTFTTANDGDGRDSDATDPGNWNTTAANGCAVGNSNWHGTHVAGIAAALGNNNTGVIGGAYGAKILPVRVLGVCGGWASDVQEGMYWAAGLHMVGGVSNPNIAKVINMSLGHSATCSASYQTAISAVVAAGSVVVVSTGNDYSTTTITSPANCTGVIAVTAHASNGNSASYANVGAGTTISAPGDVIYSTYNTGTHGPSGDSIAALNGTSMAAPHVSAAVALLLQIKSTLTPAQIKTYLTNAARAFPAGTYCDGQPNCGAGMLDAFAAVKALQIAEAVPGASNTVPSFDARARTAAPSVAMQFTISGSDAEGDAITYAAIGLPTGATFNTGTGVFDWANPILGTYSITVTPSDSGGSGIAQAVSITIANPPPASSGGGGGGGALNLADLAALVLMALAGVLFRRFPRAQQQRH